MAWILRTPTGRKPTYSTPEYFTIKLNHGGNLVKEDVVENYIDGTVNYFDYCDNDRISRTELQAMCKEVGYVEELSLYYKVCGSDGKWAFKNIQTDGDVTNMVQCLSNELLELYSVESVIERNKFVDVDVTNWVWNCGTFSQENFTFVDLATHIPSTTEPPATSEPPPTSGPSPPPTTRRRRQLNNDSDSESDSDCEVFIDSDYDLSEDDDALFDANVDTEIEWIGVGRKRVTRSDIPHDCLSDTDSEEGDSSDGFMSCDSGSDEDKEDKPKFRKYRPVVGKVQPILEEDMVFNNRAQCVEAEDGTKKMKRHLKKLTCRRCGGKGHNVRTCPSGLEAPRSKEKQCSQVITQPTFSQPSQPTSTVTRAPKAPARRGGATKGGAAPRGGAP